MCEKANTKDKFYKLASAGKKQRQRWSQCFPWI